MGAWRCQQDGACCREGAAVLLSREELAGIEVHPGARGKVFTIQSVGEGKLYLKARPCPFLDTGTGRCGVYSARPLACRQYACGRADVRTERIDPNAALPARFYTDRDFRRQLTRDRQKALLTWGVRHGWTQGVTHGEA
jgi:Fe-S-cluster containining protein